MNATIARKRRSEAARKYKPRRIDLLLVAEAPPASLERYFYFEDVVTQDALFRYVCKVLLGFTPSREGKPEALSKLCEREVFLIDLKEDPLDQDGLDSEVPGLIRRLKALRPRRIVLIKTTVYEAAFAALRDAGLPVVAERIPFPGSGQQRRFEEAFARAVGAS